MTDILVSYVIASVPSQPIYLRVYYPPDHALSPQVRGARHLATGLRVAQSLEQLFLARAGLGDEGGSHILLVGVDIYV